MTYKLVFSETAEKQFLKLDKYAQRQIGKYLDKNVDGAADPRLYGKALTGNLGELWRYRVGDYRAICKLQDNICEVLVVKIGHRREIYR